MNASERVFNLVSTTGWEQASSQLPWLREHTVILCPAVSLPEVTLGEQGMSAFCTIMLAFVLYTRNLSTLAEHVKWTNMQNSWKSYSSSLLGYAHFHDSGGNFFLQELITSLATTYILKSTHFLKCTRRVLYFTTCRGSIPWKRMGSTDGLR